MLKKVLVLSCILCAWVGSAYSGTPKFPFPQQAKYGNGILPAGVDYKHVQKVYDVWLAGYYTESGDQARIKFDEPENTVSEGIGYGMLIMVYMDNEKNNTQGKFDKLWKYYQSHGSGLMDWKISGFSGVVGSGSATDADLDAAVALLMAEKQWGGYASAASSLINNIASKDLAGDLIKGGSQWTAYNPSYMSMVATQLFANLGGGNWTTIQNSCYSLLQKAQNGTTGLWPNWCSNSGSAGGGVGDFQDGYGFDAARTPWRLGWAYVWYGHSQAKTLCSKLVTWFKSNTGDEPGKIGQMYNLNGTINTGADGKEDNIPTFLGPATCGGMVDATFQSWVDKGYTRLRAFGGTDDNYYNECLELLSMLLLSGNMPDLTKATPKSSATLTLKVDPPAAGTATASPAKDSYAINDAVSISTTNSNSSRYEFLGWQGDYEGTQTTASIKVFCDMVITAVYKDKQAADMIDDCEDGDNQTFMNSFWFSYNDALDKGKSTVTPHLTDSTHVVANVMADGGAADSKKAMKIAYKLDVGGFEYQPFVGVGFTLSPDRKSIDVSSSTGFRFSYKGTFGKTDTCALKLECDAVTELGANYSYTLTPSTTWKEVQVYWKDFLQPKWAKQVPLDKTKVPKIQWQIQGNTGSSGELWLDDIHLIGYNIPRKTGICPHGIATARKCGRLSCKQSGNHLNVSFSIRNNSAVKLSIYDMNGRLVANLARDFKAAGSYSMQTNIRNLKLANNGYMVSLSTDEGTFSRPIVINR